VVPKKEDLDLKKDFRKHGGGNPQGDCLTVKNHQKELFKKREGKVLI